VIHMDPQVTLIGMGTGLPERTNAALKDDKHTALDLWQSQKMTWDEVLQRFVDINPSGGKSLILNEQNRQLKADYPLLHEMARHMVHVSETLGVAVQSLQGLKQQQAEFSVQHLQATKLTSTNSQSNFHLQLQLLQSLLARADSNKARLQNEINLAFNAEAQRDSKVQARIGEEARKKTASMKAIAVVTMIFLPSTFVAHVILPL
ncbi:MAG: hypothetical protein LQ349_009456, partial [Xanthoria aureola]